MANISNMPTILRSPGRKGQYARRIPKSLLPALVGRTLMIPLEGDTLVVPFLVRPASLFVRCSLKTWDPRLQQKRMRSAHAYIERVFSSVRDGTIAELSHQQIMAITGEFYSAWASGPDNPVPEIFTPEALRDHIPHEELARDYAKEAAEWEVARATAANWAAKGGECLDSIFADTAVILTARFGIMDPSVPSKVALARALGSVLPDAISVRARITRGDYSPDPRLSSFPAWEPAAKESQEAPSLGSPRISGLFKGWWLESEAAGLSVSTHSAYQSVVQALIRFLGHDDAYRVRPRDIVAYKDHRLTTPNAKTGKPPSLKTIKAVDLTALRSIFEWAVVNHKLPSNPASGITVKAPKAVKVREREFTPEEATAILEAASSVPNPHKNQTELAKRWVPWLCAYTGARVGELVQLRREDIRFEPSLECWVMRVTPEAYTVKTKEYRDIPVHPHMVAMGFIEQCVKRHKGASGFLFMTVNAGKSTVRGVWQSKKNRLQEFVRTVVTDPNVAPNHGWRHSFKSRGFEAGIEEKVLDAICGHSQLSVGRQYGSVTLKTKWEAIKAFPEWSPLVQGGLR